MRIYECGWGLPFWEYNDNKMRVIAKPKLDEYAESYPNAASWLKSWYSDVKRRDCDWNTPSDITDVYRASVIDGKIVVFDVKGNDYRLVVRVEFDYHMVFIRWFGTHAEYDEIDVRKV